MFIFWIPTKINKDERPHIAVCLHVCIFICTHILQLYLYTVTTVTMTMCHMMIRGAKLLRYSLVVLAHVCWCLPKEIPGRFRVSTGQGWLPGCSYFGCGAVRRWKWWSNFSRNGGYQPCPAPLPGLRARHQGTEPGPFRLQVQSQIQLVFPNQE